MSKEWMLIWMLTFCNDHEWMQTRIAKLPLEDLIEAIGDALKGTYLPAELTCIVVIGKGSK